MRMVSGLLFGSALALATGCGPDVRDPGNIGPGDCEPTADTEVCGGGNDDDCDGFVDCDDLECSESSQCVSGNDNCGTLETPTASLVLPDGECDTGNSMPGPNAGTSCVSYDSPINFAGFTAGQKLLDLDGLLGICATMEHSYIADLQIEVSCPDGNYAVLSAFEGYDAATAYLGQPNDLDDSNNPVPGTGYEYCWTPNAANPPFLPYIEQEGLSFGQSVPAGDYQASSGLTPLVGCTLNGDWKLSVEDRFGIDNGFVFSWSVKFNPNIVEDCENWPIE